MTRDAPARGRAGGSRRRALLSLSLCAAALGCGSAPEAVTPTHGGGAAEGAGACRGHEVAVQVLGSGGPIADDGRASTGYLLWVDGRARLLVDAGPGTALRMGEASVDAEQLDAVLVSHFHVDHSSDLAGLLKSAHFGSRSRPLPVLGPTEGEGFRGAVGFVEALVSEEGAYPYLGGYLEGGRPFEVRAVEVDVAGAEPVEVLETGPVRVRAVGVPHGPVPALAYGVTVGERRVVFMGDQRADEERFARLVRGADVLVAHMAIGEGATGVAANLHAHPSRIGAVAAEAGVGTLVLSHLMGRALADLEGNLDAVTESFEGRVIVAEDGLCVPVP